MLLGGVISVGTDSYMMHWAKVGNMETFTLFRSNTLEDIRRIALGEKPLNPTIVNITELNNSNKRDYFVGMVQRSRVTGVVKEAGDCKVINQVLNAYIIAKNYNYTNPTKMSNVFLGSENGITIRFVYNSNQEIVKCDFVTPMVKANFVEVPVKVSPKSCGCVLVDASNITRRTAGISSVDKITFKDLADILDMSWYKDTKGLYKKYYTVKSVQEFEEMFDSLVRHISSRKFTVIALDTETSGTCVFNLSKDNPVLDNCVAISISWEDNVAYTIFTDMEYFQNVDSEYCFGRLAELFVEDDISEVTIKTQSGTYTLDRKSYLLTGHNAPFDRRVSRGCGHPVWFDDDTLIMAFNINPKVVRGNIALKHLTRRVFGHETPELSDVLGKGNEDKYRYLSDEEVAAIYACADADYSRLLWFVLRDLLGDKMYKTYHNQDVWLMNVLSDSEYNGLTVEMEGASKLAEITRQNLIILMEAAYKYVGAYVDLREKLSVLQSKVASGLADVSELENIEIDENAKYEFEFKATDLRKVLFEILQYPEQGKTDTGLLKVDKNTRTKLLRVKRKNNSSARKLNESILIYGADRQEYNRLIASGQTGKAKKMELISKEEFNKYEYPLALLLSKYAELDKEYTAYFKPILEGNLEGKLFKTYSLARIETRRIQNASQTMKKNLKEFIIPQSDQHYLLDFDLSQIELRLMYSLSPSPTLIEKMKNPEADGHTENAAMVHQKPAYLVTKYERKGAKGVSFGVPYGLGVRMLCDRMFGDTSDEHLFETEMILFKWKQANKPIVDMLESARDGALNPVELSEPLRNFMDAWQKKVDPTDPDGKRMIYDLDEDGNKKPIPLGAVYNGLGFCRYFDLTNIDQSLAAKQRRANKKYTGPESTIRRAAGNYPIQAYAAEFFRLILKRFYYRCKKEGIADKIVWHMLIHDELLCSVDKSIHPAFIYKLVKEECMITMKGHTKYYVGINMGDNWAETKNDDREAPILFVDRMIQEWDKPNHGKFSLENTPEEFKKDGHYWFDHPWEFIKPLRENYVSDRICECLTELQPDIENAPIKYQDIMDRFENYTVRAYILDYPLNTPVSNPKDDDGRALSCFESYVLERWGDGKEMIYPDGVLRKVTKYVEDVPDILFEDEEDEEDFIASDMYDFDTDSVVDFWFDEQEEEEDYIIDTSRKCDNAAGFTSVAPRWKCVSSYYNVVKINVKDDVQISWVKNMLGEKGDKSLLFVKGSEVIPGGVCSDNMDWDFIDRALSVEQPKNVRMLGDRMFVTCTRDDAIKIKDKLKMFTGVGYSVYGQVGVQTYYLGKAQPGVILG